MPNPRFIHYNAADDCTYISPSTTAAGTDVSNLLDDEKTDVHRFTEKSGSYQLRWNYAVSLSCVASPWCNLSPTAQARIRISDETAVDNLIRYSEGFENATYWGKGASTAPNSGASVISPSGSTNTNKLTEDATASVQHSVHQNVSGFNLGDTVTFSVFMKAAERSYGCLKFDSNSTAAPTTASVIINLSTGAMTSLTAGGWTFSTQNYGNGWWRVYATRATTAAGTLRPIICTASSSTSSVYTGVSGSGIYIWGAMLVRGDKSSYYPNLAASASATRPSGYIDSWQTYDYDSGWFTAAPADAIKLKKWSAAASANAYQWGGGTKFIKYFPEQQATGVEVSFNDPNNLQTGVELGRLIAGTYFEPENPQDFGGGLTPTSMSKITRSDSGTRHVEPGPKFDKLSLPMNYMTLTDRAALVKILRENGTDVPVLVDATPENPDANLGRDNLIYGGLSNINQLSNPAVLRHSTTLEWEAV